LQISVAFDGGFLVHLKGTIEMRESRKSSMEFGGYYDIDFAETNSEMRGETNAGKTIPVR
jgi:hypothetical protein